MALRGLKGGEDAVRGMGLADYIWLDGAGNIHVKKKAIYLVAEVDGADGGGVVPIVEPWVATVTLREGETERLLLNPCHYIPDPLRGQGNYIVLCEARTEDNENHPTNTRAVLRDVFEATGDHLGTWWGWRQGYKLLQGSYEQKAGFRRLPPTKEQYLAAERHLNPAFCS